MCVAVMYRMFAMSKHSSAPSEESASSPPIRASRSSRSRSKRIRSSQSTAIVPYVCSPIAVELTIVCSRWGVGPGLSA